MDVFAADRARIASAVTSRGEKAASMSSASTSGVNSSLETTASDRPAELLGVQRGEEIGAVVTGARDERPGAVDTVGEEGILAHAFLVQHGGPPQLLGDNAARSASRSMMVTRMPPSPSSRCASGRPIRPPRR